MWQTALIWGFASALAVLAAGHFRLRRSIRRLTLALRGQEGDDFAPEFGRWFVPGHVKALAQAIAENFRRRSRQRVREEELRQIVDSILDQFDHGFLEVGEDLIIRYANAAAREVFARTGKVVGKPVIEVFLDHRIDRIIRQALDRNAKSSGTVHLDERVQHRGETMGRVLHVEAAPVTSSLRSQRGVWVIMRDESQRHHLEQVRKDFVANASHEFRTPLSIICGYLENLEQGAVDDPAVVQRFYRVMLKHAKRLSRIVEDLLAISRLESCPEFLTAEPFDLAESVTDMVEHLQPLIHERQARVLLNLPDGDRSIYGERTVWDQVFFNLIENSLRQNAAPGLEVEVRMVSDETHHEIDVTDNGVGIPTPQLSQVFKRFYRVERHHSRNQVSGTGLGLSIVKRAVEAHGGTIQVTSVPGVETKFSIKVPRRHLAEGGNACRRAGG